MLLVIVDLEAIWTRSWIVDCVRMPGPALRGIRYRGHRDYALRQFCMTVVLRRCVPEEASRVYSEKCLLHVEERER